MILDTIKRIVFIGVVMTVCSVILHELMPVVPPALMIGVIIGACFAGAVSDLSNLFKKKEEK